MYAPVYPGYGYPYYQQHQQQQQQQQPTVIYIDQGAAPKPPPCKWWTKMVDDPSGFGMAVVALISDIYID